MKKRKKGREIVRIKVLLMLIILLVFNTYAWFIYITTVKSGVELRVKRWDIAFEGESTISDQYITVTVDEAFPGMQDAIESVIVHNNGEIATDVTYEIVSIRCFDTTYSTLTGTPKYTPEQLTSFIENDIPFDVEVYANDGNSNIIEANSEGTVNVKICWSFEADSSATSAEKKAKDEMDTEYGTKAYEWAQENNTTAPVEILLKLVAEQYNEEE